MIARLRHDLLDRGWHLGQLPVETTIDELLSICGELGAPVTATGGRCVDTVTPVDGARYVTLSHQSVPPHNDGLFLLDTPAIVVLHAVRVPASGGETLLIDAGDALQRLPARVRDKISRMEVEITAGGISAVKRLIEHGPFGPVLMFLDPRIGDAIALHCGHRLLDDSILTVIRKACRAANPVLVHQWHAGDLLVFSNVAFMHARRSFVGHRQLRRVLVRIDETSRGTYPSGMMAG